MDDYHRNRFQEMEWEENYNKLITKADHSFANGEYQDAENLYQRALGLRPDDKYPKQRLSEIKKLIP
jgi:NADPH-dependent glutamate synthase beta subunit-like oxidoreductase